MKSDSEPGGEKSYANAVFPEEGIGVKFWSRSPVFDLNYRNLRDKWTFRASGWLIWFYVEFSL